MQNFVGKIKNFLLELEKKKHFKSVLIAIIAFIPIAMYFEMQRQTNLITPVGGRYNLRWLLAAFIVETLALIWLARAWDKQKVMRGVAWVTALAFPFMLYFCMEWLNFAKLSETLKFVFRNHYYMTIFMVLVLTAIFWILNVIWRRFWISATVMSVVLMIMSYINLAKMTINSEPFLPSDFYFIGNVGEIAGFAEGALPFTIELVLGVLILAAMIVILFFGKIKCPKNPWVRIATGVICVAFCFVTVLLPKVKDYLFLADGIEMSKQYTQRVVYDTHGFMGGFLINIEGYTAPPEGYNESNIDAILTNFDKSTDGDFQQPDVIVYLGESYFDMTQMKTVRFTEDPMKNLHRIQKEALDGEMMQASGVGGGTVRSEFEVLTGINLVDMKEGLIPYNTYVDKSTEQVYGLPNYFKQLGYTTTAIHSYKRDFYSRAEVYGRMGFDTFIGEEDMENPIHGVSARKFILDDYLVDQVIDNLEQGDDPKFTFVISMENHGSFANKYEEEDCEKIASCDTWTEFDAYQANCYATSAKAADEALGKLYDYVMSREKPTVVLFFGDHMPTLGTRHSVLADAGYISTGWSSEWTDEDRYNMYRTPFLIFSNYIENTDSVGQYSSYMLSSILLDYIDAPQNGYWGLVGAMRDSLRVYNRYLTLDSDGNFTSLEDLDEQVRELVRQHTLVSYDALVGKRYINRLLLQE